MKKCVAVYIVTSLVVVGFFGLITDIAQLRNDDFEGMPEPLTGDAFIPPDRYEMELTKGTGMEPRLPAPGYWETSEYMMGTVAVGVILTESNGSIDANLEDWSAAEITNVKNEIQDGLNWWASEESDAVLSFVYNFTYADNPVSTGYEFITRSTLSHATVVSDVMGTIGYNSGNNFVRTRDYINDLRDAHKTDWSFAIFVAAGSSPSRTQFPGTIAYAWLGGPYVVQSYINATSTSKIPTAITEDLGIRT
jgi:hypothetical protein